MEYTPFAGLTVLDPNEPWADDGYSFQTRNPQVIDRFLEIGAVTHRHDAHAALPNPTEEVEATAFDSGGALPADLTVYIGFTLVDAGGGETILSPATAVTTSPPFEPPAVAPDGAVEYTAGSLRVDTYYYGLTYIDAEGGETQLGPYVNVEREPGFGSAQVRLTGLNDGMDEAGAAGWRLYRAIGGSEFHLLATGTGDEFLDTGAGGVNCDVQPPRTSRVNGANRIDVDLPSASIASGAAAGAALIRLYVSSDGGFPSPSLARTVPVASGGATISITNSVVDRGRPPDVSTSVPGASKIDPDRDLLDWHWKRPVPTADDLPDDAEPGDVRIALDTGYGWSYTDSWVPLASGAGAGGGGGHLIADEGFSLPERPILDFQGAGVGVEDATGRTIVTIPGGGAGGASGASRVSIYEHTASGAHTVSGFIPTDVASSEVTFECAAGALVRVLAEADFTVTPEDITGVLVVDGSPVEGHSGAQIAVVGSAAPGRAVLEAAGFAYGAESLLAGAGMLLRIPAAGEHTLSLNFGGDGEVEDVQVAAVVYGNDTPHDRPVARQQATAVITDPMDTGDLVETTLQLAPSYHLIRVGTSEAARVRIYGTAAQREDDLLRDLVTYPSGNHGVYLDLITEPDQLYYDLSPQVLGCDLEDFPTGEVPITVTMLDDSPSGAALVVTADFIADETLDGEVP